MQRWHVGLGLEHEKDPATQTTGNRAPQARGECYLQRWRGENTAWCISGTDDREDRAQQGERGPRRGCRSRRARSRTPALTTGAFDFILNAQKASLVDFKQEGMTRTHLLIQQIFTKHTCHRAYPASNTYLINVSFLPLPRNFPINRISIKLEKMH